MSQKQSADLKAIFKASEAVFSAKLDAIRASIKHAGLKGSAVEDLVREFFEGILPRNIGIGSGIVIDHKGKMSRQVDIILYDAAATPSFLSYGGVRLFPIECVYFVIEVKTTLGGSEFDQAVENMNSVKCLDQSAYTFRENNLTTVSLYGVSRRHWLPIFMVFALDTPSFSVIEQRFKGHRECGFPVDKQIDSIHVVGRGTIANLDLYKRVSLLPTPNSMLVVPEDFSVIVFLSIFSEYFLAAFMGGRLDMKKYLGVDVGSSKVLCTPEELNRRFPGHKILTKD